MSQAPSIALAFLGAAVFGLATAFTLSTGMGYLQREVGGDDRVLAFSAFHVIIRGGLAVAALAAGIAADLVQPIRLGNVTLDPVRLVLGCAGVVVVLGALAIGRVDPQREQAPPSRQATT